MKAIRILGMALMCVFVTASGPSYAEPPKSVDDALLDDLDNELLDGVGELKKEPSKKPTGSDKPTDREHSADEPGEDVGWPDEQTDPLGYISREMQLVERLISEQGAESGAEQVQTRIVENLAKLIEQAEQQQQSQQQSSAKNKNQQQTAQRQQVQQPKKSGGKPGSGQGEESNKPAADSTDRLGKAKQVRPDPELLRGLMKEAWGHLPAREREQMLQMSPERFLPQYELLIERYYRRLAEERSP